MFLLTTLNPFLTREPRSTGFEGIATEICLIQHVQTKTNSMHARQDRVLVEVSWTRGKCKEARMSLATGGCPRIRVPARTCFVAKWSSSSLCPFRTARGLRTLYSACSGSTQYRRCETAKSTMGLSRSLSKYSVQIQAWPDRGAQLCRRIGERIEP